MVRDLLGRAEWFSVRSSEDARVDTVGIRVREKGATGG